MLGLCLHYFTWHENSHKNIFCDDLTWRARAQWQDDMMTWQGWLDDDLPVWPPSLNWGLTPHCGGSLCCGAVAAVGCLVLTVSGGVAARHRSNNTPLQHRHCCCSAHCREKHCWCCPNYTWKRWFIFGGGTQDLLCPVQFPSFHKMSLEWVFCHFKPNHCWTLFRVTSYLKEF